MIGTATTALACRIEEYKNSKQANDIAVAAIKYYMLKFNPKSDIVFDLDQALDLQGNTGPYLQYAYARSASILDKAKSQGIEINYNISGENYNSDEIMILKKINAIESAIVEAGLGYAPHILCNYLFELAQIFNRYYSKYRIHGERDQEIVKARLILTKMVKSSLGKGLDLLGIQALEKM
jgi:arginyl-tRNA synthetase